MLGYDSTFIYAAAGGAIAVVVAWVIWISARLAALERAVHAIADNTSALRDILAHLESIDRSTSLLGGIRGVFGSKDHKKAR
ncbi:MAG TPA: hypothetical protein VN790_07580 [Steroidobacteraceae bacterium]|nr:hypothetical protein [Steroidobacteraceae bacterium]